MLEKSLPLSLYKKSAPASRILSQTVECQREFTDPAGRRPQKKIYRIGEPQKEEYICAPFRYDIALIRHLERMDRHFADSVARENSIRAARRAVADSGPNRSRIMWKKKEEKRNGKISERKEQRSNILLFKSGLA